MTYYEAKFTREAKERPTDWLIHNDGGFCRLIFIGKGGHHELD